MPVLCNGNLALGGERNFRIFISLESLVYDLQPEISLGPRTY